ncbi:hypothetical protein O0L34_g14698 [Tuta absoluta]|nr:hypothetical protein O0L34_g14698 [Tuta absoluta]
MDSSSENSVKKPQEAGSQKKEIPPNSQKICLVCGDKALGYNFNVISCESCKAFFRRNALTGKEFKCPFTNNCEITVVTRRFCQKCRLEKCLSVGMVKEFIMSEEDKAEKRRKIEENRAKKRHNTDQDDGVTSSKNCKKDTEFVKNNTDTTENIPKNDLNTTSNYPLHGQETDSCSKNIKSNIENSKTHTNMVSNYALRSRDTISSMKTCKIDTNTMSNYPLHCQDTMTSTKSFKIDTNSMSNYPTHSQDINSSTKNLNRDAEHYFHKNFQQLKRDADTMTNFPPLAQETVQYDVLNSTTCSPNSRVQSPINNELDAAVQSPPVYTPYTDANDVPYMKVYPIDEKNVINRSLYEQRNVMEQYAMCDSMESSMYPEPPESRNSIRYVSSFSSLNTVL